MLLLSIAFLSIPQLSVMNQKTALGVKIRARAKDCPGTRIFASRGSFCNPGGACQFVTISVERIARRNTTRRSERSFPQVTNVRSWSPYWACQGRVTRLTRSARYT